MAPRSELLLDTNVCAKLADQYKPDLEAIIRRLNRDFRVLVSPHTFMELLNGMLGGDGQYFLTDRERIRIMAGTKAIKCLPAPFAFALKTVLGITTDGLEVIPKRFERAIWVVLKAQDGKHLFVRGVVVPGAGKPRRMRLDRELQASGHAAGLEKHNELMRNIRQRSPDFPSPEQLAASIGKQELQTLNEAQRSLLAMSLDAWYRHERELYLLTKDGTYRFDKNPGDWMDGGQLFYLCDPNISILTDDARMQKRVAGSTQCGRILLLRDFLLSRAFQLRH